MKPKTQVCNQCKKTKPIVEFRSPSDPRRVGKSCNHCRKIKDRSRSDRSPTPSVVDIVTAPRPGTRSVVQSCAKSSINSANMRLRRLAQHVDGRFVHWSGQTLTADVEQAWHGTREQFGKLAKKFDHNPDEFQLIRRNEEDAH